MKNQLIIRAGQNSQAGIKAVNDDSCGILIPTGEALKHKGIVAAIADGVSSSEAGREASENCIQGFIADYYSTPDTWSVQTSGERVMRSINTWLYSQGQRRFHSDLGLASTLSVLILKSTTAHWLHVGDSRIYRIRKNKITCLTKDHEMKTGSGRSFLARAMGGEHSVRIDYGSTDIKQGDIFVLSTDGLHGFISDETIRSHIDSLLQEDIELTAKMLVEKALEANSDDNLTCQIIQIEQLPNQDAHEFLRGLTQLPFPPPLENGSILDGYRIIKEIHTSATIQVYLVEDTETKKTVVMKTPSVNFEDDPAYIDRFVHEEWIGRRIDNPHVLKIHETKRHRSCLYYITEYLEGQSLKQWILDNPKPDINKIRDIANQAVKGLRAFHRREMVHQDIKPENFMIDIHGTIKIIDFGCVHVAGVHESYTPIDHQHIQGTANYIAPELFYGFEGSPKSDQFSLGVTLYQLLSNGKLPYAKQDEAKQHKNYSYQSILQHNASIPVWVDGAIKRAVQVQPEKRYDSLSEFLYDLSNPNPLYTKDNIPLIERNPLAFWRGLSALLLLGNLVLAVIFFS